MPILYLLALLLAAPYAAYAAEESNDQDPLSEESDDIDAVVSSRQSVAASPASKACSDAVMAQIRAKGNEDVKITCTPSFKATDVITKRLILSGKESSGITIDCNGARLNNPARGTITVQSAKDKKGNYTPITDVTVKNCVATGRMRVNGFSNADLKTSSFKEGHTERTQAAAPRRITFENNTFNNTTNAPLYFRPGTTESSIISNTFTGFSNSTVLYLDAESTGNTVSNNVFDTRTSREVIAVDGSSHNTISGNTFKQHNLGGIFLYRNCGELGIIRHQTPSYNLIQENVFKGQARATFLTEIVLASRNGNRRYCGLDNGYPFGSSIDNRDFAQHNTVTQNTFVSNGSADKAENHIRVNATPNTVTGNKLSGNTGGGGGGTDGCPDGTIPLKDRTGKVVFCRPSYGLGTGDSGYDTH